MRSEADVLPALIARAVDRALSRCAEDDPPRVVALRVGWAVLRELERADGVRQSPGVNTDAYTTATKR